MVRPQFTHCRGSPGKSERWAPGQAPQPGAPALGRGASRAFGFESQQGLAGTPLSQGAHKIWHANRTISENFHVYRHAVQCPSVMVQPGAAPEASSGNRMTQAGFHVVSCLLFVILKTRTFIAYMALNELRIYKTVTICLLILSKTNK